MRKEFEALAESLKRWDLYTIGDEVDMALTDLSDKIAEVEKRMVCIEKSAEEINKAIGRYTERVDNNETFVMSITDHDSIMRGSHDIEIALDLNDKEVIENNWYGLFEEPKKGEPKVLIPKGSIVEWEETIQYFSAKKGAKARVLVDYTTEHESNDKVIEVEWLDELANGQTNGGYYLDKFKEGFDKPIPTYQCKNQHTFDKVKEVIQILKTLDNGDCVDGETMDYIVKELGFEEYLLRSLVMSADFKETKDLLREKFEVQI
jgi:hypothetical protein